MASAGGGKSRRRATDAPALQGPSALVCPRCAGRLRAAAEALVCPRRHRHDLVGGIVDLWPPDRDLPAMDVFSGPYGIVYDWAIKERWLARIGGRLGWGADVGPMYRLMDDGVKAAPGELILDVPVGGAPALRAAPGRMRGTYVGIDISMGMLERAVEVVRQERLTGVLLARADAADLPLADASADRVLCFNGLHVMPDKEGVLAEFRRVLKPRGELWGSVVLYDSATRRSRPWINTAAFFHPADPTALRAAAAGAGFKTWNEERSGALLYFRARA